MLAGKEYPPIFFFFFCDIFGIMYSLWWVGVWVFWYIRWGEGFCLFVHQCVCFVLMCVLSGIVRAMVGGVCL